MKKNVNLYSPYYLVLQSKVDCYSDEIVVFEGSAEVRLQKLLDHTCQRLVEVQDEFLF